MMVPSDAVRNLESLASKDNFVEEGIYTGVHDPVLRENLNRELNETIKNFIEAVVDGATKERYIILLRDSIGKFDRIMLDTEDAERVALNFEKIMDCIGLDSSDGVLNEWMYGFDPK